MQVVQVDQLDLQAREALLVLVAEDLWLAFAAPKTPLRRHERARRPTAEGFADGRFTFATGVQMRRIDQAEARARRHPDELDVLRAVTQTVRADAHPRQLAIAY